MRFPRDARRAFVKLKRQRVEHGSKKVKPSANHVLVPLAFSLGIGMRRTKRAVALLKAYGFVTERLKVPGEIKELCLSRVSIDSGENMFRQKEQRRVDYFKTHGSMKTSDSEIARSIRLVPKPFKS